MKCNSCPEKQKIGVCNFHCTTATRPQALHFATSTALSRPPAFQQATGRRIRCRTRSSRPRRDDPLIPQTREQKREDVKGLCVHVPGQGDKELKPSIELFTHAGIEILELRVEVHVDFRHEHGMCRREAGAMVLLVPAVQDESQLSTELRRCTGTSGGNFPGEPSEGTCVVVHDKVQVPAGSHCCEHSKNLSQ